MNGLEMLTTRTTQANFAKIIGVSEAKVSQLMADGLLPEQGTCGEWLAAYVERLREQAAGRMGSGELDLVQERAALAKSQRIGQEMRNAIAVRDYVPIALLESVLADIARKLCARLDALVPTIRRRYPELPVDVIRHLAEELAACREQCAAVNLDEQADGSSEEDDEGDEQTPPFGATSGSDAAPVPSGRGPPVP